MASKERVLVIIDPTAGVQPALERAAWLARRMRCSLELFICIHGNLPLRRLKGADSRAARRTLLGHQVGYLKQLATDYPDLAIEVKAVWDRPLHEAIIRETLCCAPRFVLKDTHYHAPVARALLTNTDWHLIRDCPAPLWLVRAGSWPDQPVMLACVDPLHEGDAGATLDKRILGETQRLARAVRGEAHALHCYDSASLVAATGSLPGMTPAIEGIAAALQAEHAGALSRLARAQRLPAERTHFRSGPPIEAVPAAVRQLKASLVSIGALARSRLRQAFVGGTAEKLLDHLPCDVLIIRPGGFESSLTYRSQPSDFMELR